MLNYKLAFVLFVLQRLAFAQFQLPSFEVLADEGIRSIDVNKRALRMVDMNERPIKEELDTSMRTLERYYLNGQGRIDSIYFYPTLKGYYKKIVYSYDVKQRMCESITFDYEGEVLEMSKSTVNGDGSILYQEWNGGVLSYESYAREDSAIFKMVRFQNGLNSTTYWQYSYDFEQEIELEQSFVEGQLRHEEKAQWIANNNVPLSFIYAEFNANPDPFERKNFAKTYDVNEKGEVVNKLNGFFYDPYVGYNYFERIRYFKGMKPHAEHLFKVKNFVESQEVIELFSFDGKQIVYRYDFVYN